MMRAMALALAALTAVAADRLDPLFAAGSYTKAPTLVVDKLADGAEPRFFLDPFHGGRILRQEHLIQRLTAMSGGRTVSAAELARYAAPASSRQILVRLNNNLKGSYLRRQDLDGVLRTIDRLLALDASLMGERRDRGWVLARLGRNVEAIDDLETYLLVHPSARDADMVREHLEELRSGQD